MTKSDDLKDRLDELFSSIHHPPEEHPSPPPSAPSAPPSAPSASSASSAVPSASSAVPSPFALLEHLPAGAILTGLDGRLMNANHAFCTMLGYAPEELIGQQFQAITYSGDLQVDADAMRAMLSGETNSAQFEKRYLHKDGQTVWVQMSITLMRDAQGQPVHFAAIAHDLTKQYRMAALLEKRLRELNCLSEIGHRIDEKPPLQDFLPWVAERLPAAFQYPNLCVAAIEYDGQVYGNPDALTLPASTVGGLRIGEELVGWLHIAYTQPRDFVDAESALVGGIVSRLSGYIESQRLISRANASVREARLAQQLLSNVIDRIPNPIFVKDTAGIYTGCNRAFLEYLGQPAEAILGKSVYDLNTNRELADKYHEMDMALFRNPGLQVYESSVKYADGSLHQVIFNKATFNNPDGSLAGLVGTMLDITERKIAEQTLTQERQLLRTLIDNIPDFIFVKDRQSRYVVNNLAHLHNCGVQTQEEAAGKSDFDFFPAEDAAGYHAAEQQLMENGLPLLNHVESGISQITGGLVWVSTSKIPLRNEQGEIIGLVGINHDVTRERIAEQILARRANELATVARVSTAVATSLEPQELLQSVVDLTKQNFGLYHAHIYLLESRPSAPSASSAPSAVLVLAAGAGEAGAAMVAQGWNIPLDREQSLVARAARQRQGVIVNDVRSAPDFLPNHLLPETCAELAVPLIAGDELLGVLDVQSDHPGAFSDQDVIIQTTLAYQVAVALQNARLYARAQRALGDTEALYEGSAKVASATDMPAILDSLVLSTDLKNMHRANILFFDRPWDSQHQPETMTVAAVWERSQQPTRFPIGTVYPFNRFPAFRLLDRDQPTVVPDVHQDPRADENLLALLDSAGMRSILCFPLRISGQWIGMVTGQSPQPCELSSEQIRRTNALMDQAATVAQNLRLIDQIQSALAETRRSQQALLREQRLLRTLIDNLPDYVYAKDRQSRFIVNNQAHLRLLGLPTQADALGKTDMDVFPGENAAQYYQDEQTLMASGQPLVAREEPVIDQTSGQAYWVSSTKIPLLDETGEVVGLVGITHDITLQREAAQTLVRTAGELATVAEISTVMTGILEPQQLLQAAVDLIRQRFNIDHVHIYLLAASTRQLILTAAASLQRFSDSSNQCFPQGCSIPLNAPGDTGPLNPSHALVARAMRLRQGILLNDLHLTLSASSASSAVRAEMAIPLIAGDQPLGVLHLQSETQDAFSQEDLNIFTALSSQITVSLQTARQYAAVQASERLVRTIIDSTPDWIFIKDQDQRYRLVNRSYADSLGIPAEVFIGKNDLELGFVEEIFKSDPESKHPPSAPPSAPSASSASSAVPSAVLSAVSETHIYPNPDDPATIGSESRIFQTIKAPLHDENSLVWGILAFSHDVTERERLLSEANTQAQTLAVLNDMSHALASTLDYAQILQTIYQYTSRLMDASNFYVAVYDEPAGQVTFPIAYSDKNRVAIDARPLSHGLTDYVIRTQRPLLLNNPEGIHHDAEALGIQVMHYADQQVSYSWLGVPMLYGSQVVGVLSVQSTTAPNVYSERQRDIFLAVASQSASAFALARQYQQTQHALAASEKLYAGSQSIIAATSFDQVLRSVIDSTALKNFEHGSLTLYDRPWDERGAAPEKTTFIAGWERTGAPTPLPLGMTIPMRELPFTSLLARPEPMIFTDIANDPRLDENARTLLNRLALGNSLAFFPLLLGRQSIGTLTMSATQPVTLSEEQLRHIFSLIGQAAAVTQAIQLLRQAQARLQREQSLREISTRVRASSDPEVILRSAVQQLGDALGRKTFVQLAPPPGDSPGGQAPSSGDNHE